MGPALETFLQALFYVVLLLFMVVWLPRRHWKRLYRKLREIDREQMEAEQSRKDEEAKERTAREAAAKEVDREIFGKYESDRTEAQTEEEKNRRM